MSQPILTKTGQVAKTVPRVYTKYLWADSWELMPYLHPVRSTRECAPNLSEADFLWRFGKLHRFGYPPVQVQQIDLADYYIKITGMHANGEEELLWVGIVVDDQVTIKRSGRGTQEIKAVGLEHMLDRQPINRALVIQNGTRYSINWAPAFNERYQGAKRCVDRVLKRIKGNRAANELRFGNDNEPWELWDAVWYLISFFNTSGIEWQLGGQSDVLHQFKHDVWEQEGKTIRQFLNDNINRSRGIGWKTKLVDSGPVEIQVYTQTDTTIRVGNRELAANTNSVPFFLPAFYPDTHLYNIGVLRYANSEVVSEIVVQGERIEMTGSYRYIDFLPDAPAEPTYGPLDFGWTAALGLEYDNPPGATDVEAMEAARSTDRYARVYTTWTVDPNWDWRLPDTNGVMMSAFLETDDDGGVQFGIPVADEAGYWTHGKQFLPLLPFQEGVDYSVFPPDDPNPENSVPQYRQIAAFLKDEEDNRWFYVNKADHKDPGRLHPCCTTPLYGEWGVRIESSPRHHIAKAMDGRPDLLALNPVFNGDTLAGYVPELCYYFLRITATIQTDQRQHITLYNPNPVDTDRKLVITVPDAEYWIVHPGTIVDVSGNGELQHLAADPDAKVLRNDLELLEAVAAFAKAYYFTERQALSVEVPYVSATLPVSPELGVFLTEIVGLNTRIPVKAIVTSQEIDYRRQVTVTKTSYLSLDELIQAGLYFAKAT